MESRESLRNPGTSSSGSEPSLKFSDSGSDRSSATLDLEAFDYSYEPSTLPHIEEVIKEESKEEVKRQEETKEQE